jgi:rhodanese-related sulfurtransferase
MRAGFTTSLTKFAALVLVCCITIFETQDKVHFSDLFSELVTAETAKRPAEGFQALSLPETLCHFHTQGVLFLDTRRKQDYDSGHIEGARNLPMGTSLEISADQIQQWEKAPVIVIYCDGVFDGTAYRAALMLKGKGFGTIKIYPDGWPEWKNCQLPIAVSKETNPDFATGKP